MMTIRQGDVALIKVPKMPAGCTEVPLDKGRIVLAYGEVTGHAHAIEVEQITPRVKEIAEAVIARARLWRASNGERFLEVMAPVSLKHEEHTEHVILPGIYHVPRQVEYVAPEITRNVHD